MLVVLCVMKKALCVWKYDLKAFISNPDYRICSIRRHGYYLFHRAILCGFYLRAATNWERHLLNSVFLVKFFVIVRALRKASFIRLTKGLWCSFISRRFAAKWYLHSTSNSFSSNDFTRWSPSVPQNFSGQCAFLYLSRVYSFDIAIRARGLFTCARATQIFAAGSIRERRLFRSACPEMWQQFESGVWSSKYSILLIKFRNIELRMTQSIVVVVNFQTTPCP